MYGMTIKSSITGGSEECPLLNTNGLDDGATPPSVRDDRTRS